MTAEEAIKYLKYMQKHIGFNKIGYVYGNEAIETVLNLIEKQQAELKKKDKIIDELIEKLSYVEDLKLDVCVNCKEDCRIPRNQGDCIKTDCIKEYFKKKVEVKDE